MEQALREALRSRVHSEAPGIWRYAGLFEPQVGPQHRLSLGEGHTPLVRVPALERALEVGEVWLKREDLAPGGSHKARSLAYRVSLALQRGEPALSISSSGNAAVAASMYAAAAGLQLFAFVSPSTNPAKLRWLERSTTTVILSSRPRNLARYAGRLFGVPNLTPSLDVLSVEGFKTLAAELVEQGPNLEHVFTFVTSGSSLVGLGRTYAELGGYAPSDDQGLPRLAPGLHAVQTGETPVIAGPWDLRFQQATESKTWQPSKLAGLLGVDDTPRAEEARHWVHASGGAGWVEHDAEILEARDLLRNCGIDTSAEGAACLSAARRARALGTLHAASRIALILCGHASQWPASLPEPFPPQGPETLPGEADTQTEDLPHPTTHSSSLNQSNVPAIKVPAIGIPAVEIAGYTELRSFLKGFLAERPRDDQGDSIEA